MRDLERFLGRGAEAALRPAASEELERLSDARIGLLPTRTSTPLGGGMCWPTEGVS